MRVEFPVRDPRLSSSVCRIDVVHVYLFFGFTADKYAGTVFHWRVSEIGRVGYEVNFDERYAVQGVKLVGGECFLESLEGFPGVIGSSRLWHGA